MRHCGVIPCLSKSCDSQWYVIRMECKNMIQNYPKMQTTYAQTNSMRHQARNRFKIMRIKKNFGSHAGGNLETGPPLISNKSPFDLKTLDRKLPVPRKVMLSQQVPQMRAICLPSDVDTWSWYLMDRRVRSKWPDLSRKPTTFAYLGKP